MRRNVRCHARNGQLRYTGFLRDRNSYYAILYLSTSPVTPCFRSTQAESSAADFKSRMTFRNASDELVKSGRVSM